MTKVYNLLAAGALLLTTATSASARYWTYDSQAPVAAAGIQANTPYALQSGFGASVAEPWFLAGNRFTNTHNLTLEQVYQFVPVTGLTDKEGSQVYYLQRNDASKEYLAEPSNGQFYTASNDRAWKIVVKDAHYEDLGAFSHEHTYQLESGQDTTVTMRGFEGFLQSAKDMQDPTVAYLQQLTSNPYGTTGGVVIVSYESNNKEDQYAQYTFFLTHTGDNKSGTYAIKGTDYNRNLWVIYPASEQTAVEAFNNVVSATLGGASDLESKIANYQLGAEPGQYSKEKHDALMAIWQRVQAAQSNGATDAEYDALADEFPKAYNAFVTSGVGLRPGYYILTNWRSEADNNEDRTKYDDGAIYDASAVNASNKLLQWTYNGKQAGGVTYVKDEELAPKHLKMIWQVTADPENPELFYFQNVETKNYIGYVTTRNTKVPVTATPEASYNITANPDQPGFFTFYSPKLYKNDGAEYGGLHAAGDYEAVVAWGWRTGGSSWHVRAITQEQINAIQAAAEQPRRNEKMAQLAKQAANSLDAGYSYMGVDANGAKIPASTTGEIGAVDGLITNANQRDSPMAELNEKEQGKEVGPVSLIDNNIDTYFHTAWSNSERMWKGGHYLQMSFETAQQDLYVKWVKRIANNNVNNGGAPLKVVFWGTNDAAKLALNKTEGVNEAGENVVNYNAWKTGWDSLGVSTFKYPYEVLKGTTKIANAAGAAYAKFSQAYKYVRMEVLERVANGDKPNGNVYMHGSEMRVYKGAYDAAASLNESVPADVINALKAQIAKANEEVAAGLATEATLASLQAAYDTFLKNYPDPARVRTAIATAKSLESSAAEGAVLGYYATGSKATYLAAINAVETDLNTIVATRQPNATEVSNFLARLDAATAAFNSSLNMPTNGIYTIVSASSNASNTGRKVYAKSSSRENSLYMGGLKQVGTTSNYTTDPDFASNLAQFWEVTKQDTGYVVKNVFNGLYLAPVKGKRVVSLSETPYVLPIQFAKVPGLFHLVIGKEYASADNIYMNAEPASWVLTTWNAASGRDNSAFEFVAVDRATVNAMLTNGFSYELQSNNKPQFITLPIDARAEGGFYTVIGQKQDDMSIQLKATNELKAGQGYVYIPDANSTSWIVTLGGAVSSISDLNPTHTALPAVNGLQGVFENTELPVASGLFSRDRSKILLSEPKEKVGANTGYFSKLAPTTETGDAQLQAGGIVTSIGQVVLQGSKAAQGIYNLQGIRFNSTKQLPAGVYVIDGKKVVVK